MYVDHDHFDQQEAGYSYFGSSEQTRAIADSAHVLNDDRERVSFSRIYHQTGGSISV